jgi:hypothetical protein
MVHRVVRFHQDHLVFRRQLQNIGRRFLSPDEQDAGNIRHLCRPDRLHVAQTRDEEPLQSNVRTSLIRSLAKAHCTSWSSRPLPHTTVAPVSAIICRIFIII